MDTIIVNDRDDLRPPPGLTKHLARSYPFLEGDLLAILGAFSSNDPVDPLPAGEAPGTKAPEGPVRTLDEAWDILRLLPEELRPVPLQEGPFDPSVTEETRAVRRQKWLKELEDEVGVIDGLSPRRRLPPKHRATSTMRSLLSF